MRTTLVLNDTLLREAQRLTGLGEKTAVVHAGLEALIVRESARLGALLEKGHVRTHPFVERHRLMGAGIGWIDAKLRRAARRLDLAP